jgi:hypothetical protein
MKAFLLAISLTVMVVPIAQAGHIGLGGQGGSGFGGQHGGFGGDGFGGGGRGFGGGFDTERIQTRFETKFEGLVADYDTGLADIEDFYASDDYTDIVDGVETLADRYDLFLSSVERTIASLTDYISIATDDLTFYADLLTEYQARDDLSEERLERIETRLTNIQEHLTTKIDTLTEKQTTLSENLGTYQTFSETVSTYLNEIVTAGGGTTDPADTTTEIVSGAVALRSVAELAALPEDSASFCETPESALAATAAPEPATHINVLLALVTLAMRRPKRWLIA